MIWIKTEKNNTVTDYYLKTISIALETLDQQIMIVESETDIRPEAGDIVVVSTATSLMKFRKMDIKIVYWAQGAWPEESYMRHRNPVRYIAASFIERIALKRADFVFFVSTEMKKHFEKKYKLSFKHFYIMPCSNESFHANSFFEENKYSDNVFCYAGSASVWQCVEQSVMLYSELEKKIPRCKLLLLLRNQSYAKSLVEKYNIKNYEIDFVSIDELEEKLKHVKYGFLLRSHSVVNSVATPTKVLTYISNGIIPIYSDCLTGVNEILSTTQFKLPIKKDFTLPDFLSNGLTNPIDARDIYADYSVIFEKYYNRANHIEHLKPLLHCLL